MIGSFWGYHAYLISTNEITLEQLIPFLILRVQAYRSRASIGSEFHHKGPLIAAIQERLLASVHRGRVRYPIRKIRLDDLVSTRRNWVELFGGGRRDDSVWKGWLNPILCGGKRKGDGYRFEFSAVAKRQLDRPAEKLAKL